MDDETPNPRQKRGPKPGSAPFARDPELARRAGQAGAARVQELYGREHYQQIGQAGGRKLSAARGREYYAAIGRLGGLHKKKREAEDAPHERD